MCRIEAKTVAEIEHARLIPGAMYWSDEVRRSTSERVVWLEGMRRRFPKTEIVFFDPDNGLEVKSKPWKVTASPKHLYWKEVSGVWADGQSAIIYQHFRREQRDVFISEMKHALKKETDCSSVFALRTSHVVFLIAAQENHRARVERASLKIEQKWKGEIWLQ